MADEAIKELNTLYNDIRNLRDQPEVKPRLVGLDALKDISALDLLLHGVKCRGKLKAFQQGSYSPTATDIRKGAAELFEASEKSREKALSDINEARELVFEIEALRNRYVYIQQTSYRMSNFGEYFQKACNDVSSKN